MSEQMTAEEAIVDPTVVVPLGAPRARLGVRMREGVSSKHNWIQLVKFGVVGASGYAINLVVYELVRNQLNIHYLIAAVIAFAFAVTNNFLLNRSWTFKATDGHAGFQGARFMVVSLAALVFNLVVLKALVAAGMGELPAQAIAVVCSTPMNFIGNKLWSFRA